MVKSKLILSIAFLLMLFVSPSFLIASAAYGEISPESITSFSETLPDDVMFTPDLGVNTTNVYAYQGEGLPDEAGLLSNTYVEEGLEYFGGYDSTSPTTSNVTIDFEIQDDAEGFHYYFRLGRHLQDFDGVGSGFWVWNYDISDWELLVSDVPRDTVTDYKASLIGNDYYNQTGGMGDGGFVKFLFNSSTLGTTTGCYIYYGVLNAHIIHLADVNHYAESFTNVTDWASYTMDGDDSFSSDNDVLSIEASGEGANDYAAIYTNSPSLATGQYLEFYYKVNQTTIDYISVRVYDADDHVGAMTEYTPATSTSWLSYKILLTQAVESVVLGIRQDLNDQTNLQFDYLRISPSNETGYQHDGSTTHSVTHTTDDDFTFSQSSDSDILTLAIEQIDTDTGTERFYLWYDATDTPSNIDADYYPLFKMYYRVTEFVNLSTLYLRIYVDGGNYESFALDTSGEWTTFYCNMGAFTSNDPANYAQFRIYSSFNAIGDKFELDMDFAKLYSIADFAVTQSSTTTDDYLYVDSGILYSNMDDGTIELNHDPAISVSDTYSGYNLTTSGTAPEFSMYVSEWSAYSDDTSGATTSGTLTDFKLRFDSTEIISAIKFIDTHDWQESGIATIYFIIPIDETGLNMLLIFLGLLMIPASTLYLVKGGRSEASWDKLFFGLIAFVIGWALFLGGIFG